MEEDYLDEDEQFELMYADEIEAMNELDTGNGDGSSIQSRAKRSLNFDNASDMTNGSIEINSDGRDINVEDEFNSSLLISAFCQENDNFTESSLIENSIKIRSIKRSCDNSYDDKFTECKRSRIEDIDEELELIEIIKQRRRAIQEAKVSFGDINNSFNDVKVLVSRTKPNCNFVGITNQSGEKFYVKIYSDDVLKEQTRSIVNQCKNINLLSVPFCDIQAAACEMLRAKKDKLEQEAHSMAVDVENSAPHSDVTELWVEKYKPTSYAELLSDEGTNRALLQWLKLWDKVVFGRERTSKIKRDKQPDNKKKFGYKFIKQERRLTDELDENDCPKYKIALLCGPPGLGKTTLAHMVVKHAGYNVIEMNASDDRSPEIFRIQLESATQMTSVMDISRRPNCLVIDEIDGAPQVSVDLLVNFCKGKIVAKGKGKKGHRLTGILRKPIICICNDLYVPALRSLRQIAFVLHFPPTPINRLSQRLVEISKAEEIETDLTAMMALCEITNSDIRSCLSTIYCLKDQPIRLTAIHNKANIGNKDMQKGLFTVWQNIFQILSNKSYSAVHLSHVGSEINFNESLVNKRVQFVLQNVQSNGDYEKLMQGVYENCMNIKKEFSLNEVFHGLEWFCFYNELNVMIGRTQNYSLLPYLPYGFGIWHLLFSSYNRPKIQYPSMLYELKTKQSQSQRLVHDVMQGMPAMVRAYCHYNNLLLDTLPVLLYIATPSIRSINLQLYGSAELDALRSVVCSMMDYNINFVQTRLQDGNYEFIMEPNIETVARFPDTQPLKSLSYPVRQLIAKEIELEKMRRLENALFKDKNEAIRQHNKPIIANQNDVRKPEGKSTIVAANFLNKLTSKGIEKVFKPKRDFFGRIINTTSSQATKRSAPISNAIKSSIWFRPSEGACGSVRRPVYMRDLL